MLNKVKRDKITLAFILLCSIGAAAAVALSVAGYGPGITHDSAAYMYAAQSLLNGEGFQYFGYPSPFIQWPPLYPALLALGGLTGLTFRFTSTLLNCFAFALIVFFAGRWMFANFKSRLLSIGGTLLLFLSVPLLRVSEYLWTESLFVLFFLLFYIELERFFQHGKMKSLILAALFSALVCIDRYAGVTIAAAACLFLLFSKKGFIKGILHAALYGAITIIPMGGWVIRNYIVSGTLLGVRLPSTFPLKLNIKRTLESVYNWIQPDKLLSSHVSGPFLNALKLFSVLVPALIVTAFILFLIRGLIVSASARKLTEDLKHTGHLFPIAFFTVFSAIYIVYLIASATSVAFEPINSRYLIPVYLPAVLGILTAADLLLDLAGKKFKTTANVLPAPLVFLILLYLAYPLVNTAATVLDSWRNGAGGYSAAAWRKTEGFLEYMRDDGQTTYYSNCADAVYTMSDIRTFSPPKKSGPYMYGLEQFKAAVARDKSSVLIWFDSTVPPTLYGLDELSAIYRMEEIGSFVRGKVYRLVK